MNYDRKYLETSSAGYRKRRVLPDILIYCGGAVFLIILVLVASGRLQPFDQFWLERWKGSESAFITDWLRRITSLGSFPGMAGVTAGGAFLLFCLRRFRSGVWLAFIVLSAWASSESLKWLLHRPRPSLPWWGEASGYSFPSGHALLTGTLYWCLAFLIFTQMRRRWSRVIVLLLFLIPLVTGFSRIWLGVHYPSDVLAGWSLAAVWTGVAMRTAGAGHAQTRPRSIGYSGKLR